MIEKVTAQGCQNAVSSAANFSGSDTIGTGFTLTSLKKFFTIVAAKGAASPADCEGMLNAVTLRSRSPASCLGIIAASGKGPGTGLLAKFEALAKNDKNPAG